MDLDGLDIDNEGKPEEHQEPKEIVTAKHVSSSFFVKEHSSSFCEYQASPLHTTSNAQKGKSRIPVLATRSRRNSSVSSCQTELLNFEDNVSTKLLCMRSKDTYAYVLGEQWRG